MLRDEIGDVLLNFRLLGLTIKEGEDAILALIDTQRCVWIRQIEDNHEYYTTSCDLVDLAYHTYCPKCGKRIEVKGS